MYDVCMYVRMYVCMYVRMYVCECVCVCVCVCACVYTYTYIYILCVYLSVCVCVDAGDLNVDHGHEVSDGVEEEEHLVVEGNGRA